jgi:hypothetical protein
MTRLASWTLLLRRGFCPGGITLATPPVASPPLLEFSKQLLGLLLKLGDTLVALGRLLRSCCSSSAIRWSRLAACSRSCCSSSAIRWSRLAACSRSCCSSSAMRWSRWASCCSKRRLPGTNENMPHPGLPPHAGASLLLPGLTLLAIQPASPASTRELSTGTKHVRRQRDTSPQGPCVRLALGAASLAG